MFKLILDEQTTDPQALAVQQHLQRFIFNSVQSSHGGKLDAYCSSFDQLSIITSSRMAASDSLIVEANTRIETLQAHQANYTESLKTLQQILMQ
jgi:vacuolar-type H+-ATPase subunit I/STV1